ncbi:MAG: hypothetical protein K8S87_04435 [Planctomycetes bacterium]|nr:hypothetical protein [Planctomycetota bacterium]
MYIRLPIAVLLFIFIGLAFSASDDKDDKTTYNADLVEIFDVMYSLDTWGMANEDKLIDDMLSYLKTNSDNIFSFIISDDLKTRLNWKNYHQYKSLTDINLKGFMGWNRRYFENLLIKYFYLNNKIEKVDAMCKSRTFVPDYYIAGPLKENWNQQLRVQWSYLLDVDFVFNTPFGDVKYQKIKNTNYAKNVAIESKESFSFINGDDYVSETYLCAFSAYFNEDTELLVKLSESDLDVYINGVPLKQNYNSNSYSNRILFPIKFSEGRYDFVIQTQEYPEYFDAEFLSFDNCTPLKVDFNKKFNYGYGTWSVISKNTINWISQNNEEQKVIINGDESKTIIKYLISILTKICPDSDIATFYYALNYRKNEMNYETWETLKMLHEKGNSIVFSYNLSKYTSHYLSLPSNYYNMYSKPILDIIVSKYPQLIRPKIDLYEYEYDRNNYKYALKILDSILIDNPKSKSALKEKINFLENRNWYAQKYSLITKTSKLFPKDVELLLMKIKSYRNHNNYRKTKELIKILLTIIPASHDTYRFWRDYLNLCINSMDKSIDINKMWLEVIKMFNKYSVNSVEDYCEYLVECGENNKALKYYKELFKKTPNSKSAKNLSKVYFLLNDTIKGKEYLIKSIKMNHENNNANKEYLLNMIDDRDSELYKKYTIPIDKVLKTKINPSDYPDSPSIVLLDEEIKRVFMDGSSTSIITTVRKVLTQEGVEEYGSVTISGDLISAKVVKSNGEIFEPSTLGKTINFEGIEIGSTQIVIYREMSRKFNSKFYFSDPERKEYFLNSRIVILKTKKFEDFIVFEKGINPLMKYNDAEYQILVYELKNSPPVAEEHDYEPRISEFLPHINITNANNDPQLTQYYLLERNEVFLSPPLIKRKVDQLIKNTKLVIDKVKVIYDFVANEIENDLFIVSPSETLLKSVGNRENLFFALLTSADIKFEKIKIITSETLLEFELSKNIDCFTDINYVNAIRINNGKNYIYQLFEPRLMEYIPCSFMPYYGAIGLSYENKMDIFIIANDNSNEYLLESSQFDISLESSEVSANGTIILSQKNSNILKYNLPQFSDYSEKQLITQIIQEKLSNYSVSNYELRNLTSNKPLTINIKGKFINALHEIDTNRTEVSMCLKPFELLQKYAPTPKRKLGMKINNNENNYNIDRRIILIPDNCLVLNLPSSAFYITKAFIYLLDVKQQNGKIVITRKFKKFPAKYDVDEYESLKQYCKAIDTLEKNCITFLKITEIDKDAKKQ